MGYLKSRIYVKDFPKHATEDRLREFFSEKGEITDCKLIRTRDGKSRQFAFVGYRTEQEAEEAIRYFNKSFLDTSRISCEFALKQGDPNIPCPQRWYSKKKEEKTQRRNQNQVSESKYKTEKSANISKENDDPKCVEFFQVMQPRSKSKLWENDLVVPTLEHITAGSEESIQLQQEGKGSMKKLNTAKTAQDDGMHDENTDRPLKLAHDLEVPDMEYFKHRVKKEWSDSESDGDNENGIDMDQHDDDNSGPKGNQKELGAQNFTASVGQNTLKGIGVFEEPGGEFVSSGKLSSPQDANEVLQSRLFVSNLPYAATEDELADLFSKFGNIANVHLVIDKETKQSKGFAYVLYSAPEAASREMSR